ncbi:hypothetical protein [Labilibaculum sp.]|uniref:hypothetical protein n=1 Tax=Labilibaculum sp. TaxID=2060723 RepID=UPI0035653D2B
MAKTYFKFRQEELPVVGEILLQLFTRDRAKFEDFSAEYNDEYLASLQAQIQKIKDLTQAPTLTAEIKKITEDLYSLMGEVIPKLDLIAAYAHRANSKLLLKSSDFGVKDAKKELRRKNVEGFFLKMKIVQQNIASNLEALTEKGYKESLGSEIEEMSQKVYNLNLKQEDKLSKRKQLVVDNNAEFTIMWKMLSDLSKTGKMLLKSDDLKSKEYMFTKLINKVRNIPVTKEVKKDKRGSESDQNKDIKVLETENM